MQAYISVSYSKRKSLQPELNAIIEILQQYSVTPFVFVDNYNFDKSQEKLMMQQAFAEIDKSDLLITETSDKAIGIGVEVGYARAKNKSIFYLRRQDAEHSTTVSGASDFHIFYTSPDNLKKQLGEILKKMKG